MSLRSLVVLSLLLSSVFLVKNEAAEIEPFKNNACPEGWSDNSKPIPVINNSLSASPWSNESSDRTLAKRNIAESSVIETVDALPVTDDILVDDLLTVASECLAWRNKAVNGEQHFPTPGVVEYRPEHGHLAASVF